MAREIEIFSNLLASLNNEASSVDEKHKNLDFINQAIEQYLEAYQITGLQGFTHTQLTQIVKCPKNANTSMLELVCRVIGIIVKSENAHKFIQVLMESDAAV